MSRIKLAELKFVMRIFGTLLWTREEIETSWRS